MRLIGRTTSVVPRRHRVQGVAVLLVACLLVAAAAGGGQATAAHSSSAAKPKVGTLKDVQPISRFCGKQKVTIGYADSFGSVNAWRKITTAELVADAKKCKNVRLIITDGQGSLQKSIANINGLIAQKVDGLIVMAADFGPAILPAARKATKAGIPTALFLGLGLPGSGKDYVANVASDEVHDGARATEWLAAQLNGQGNVIHVGGAPGNPLSNGVHRGLTKTLARYPALKLLIDRPIDTNFSPVDEQKAVAGVLAQHSEIDGVLAECGTCTPGGWRAFQAAGRELVPWATDDNNEIACLYYDLKKANPKLQLQTQAARNWLIRVALHKVVAVTQGIKNNEPNTFSMPIVEDSTKPRMQPKCVRSAPAGAIWSSLLTDSQVIAAVK